MSPRLRWALVACCALVLGLETPAALAVLRGPVAPAERDARRLPEAGSPASELGSRGLEHSHG